MADLTDSNDPARYAYLAEGNATQARKRVAVNLLVRDSAGRVLLVDPVYKKHWDLLGGMVEANEPPTAAARREAIEELGLDAVVGRLLLVGWAGPRDPWDDQLVLVFDGGTIDDDTAGQLHPVDAEIAAVRFATPDAASALLRPDVHQRLTRSLDALVRGHIVYEEHQRTW